MNLEQHIITVHKNRLLYDKETLDDVRDIMLLNTQTLKNCMMKKYSVR